MESQVAHDAIINDPFPFRRVASLEKLIQFWRIRADSDSESTRTIAKEVIRRMEEVPALMAPEVSMSDLKSHPELLDLLMTAVFPPARLHSTIASAFPPFELQPFYATGPFEKLKIMERFLLHNHIYGFKIGMEEMLRGKALSAYHKIAEELYNVKIGHGFPFVITLPDEETGLNKYYRIIIDPSFISLKTPNGVPELSEQDRRRLVAEPHNLELWLELLDPDCFEIHGFVVMNAVDVTEPEILSKLKNQLLLKDALTGEDNLNRIERLLQELFDRPKIRLGLMALDRCRTGQVSGARSIGKSLLLSGELPSCEHWEDSLYASVLTTGERVFVDDLHEVENNTAFENRLKEQGFRNLFLAPLQFKDMPLGVFELGSTDCCDINANHGALLYEVTALLSTAISRSLEEQEDRVQAIIKKQYTAIHPVVEWRFREAALNRITAAASNDQPIENIVFDQVFPLYGMSDIRGSSDYRSNAIQDDLTTQLGLALAVIVEASAVRPRPSLDELGYRLSRHIEDLVSGTRDGDEQSLILLLQTEVEPLFERFKALSPSVADRVHEYMKSLDPDLGVVYDKRKAFEESVTRLNEAISLFLDKQEEQAQSMVEHYYEKYQTDGVEYNIYAGSSLLQNGQFDELDLKNLKLWQLTTMAGVVWEMKRIQPSLRIPLETAHLILVQSVPLSIRFRIDEKKFDVDGAYNIRYEIVKKRIDKAQIAGTSERLTQPGMIAIVYSQESEASEYIQYLEYLQAAGYLEPGIERVELERLQGVHGLKALRVSVSERNPAVDFEKEDLESDSTAVEDQVAEQPDVSN